MGVRSLQDLYDNDGPRVTIQVNGVERREVLGYSYTSDILTLSDSFTIDVANPDGIHSGTIDRGHSVKVRMADPAVNGGAEVQRLVGVVTNMRQISRGGMRIQIQGADLGYHLEQSDAELWLRLSGLTFDALLAKVLKGYAGADLGWEFAGIALENDRNRRLNQGRAGVERSLLYRAETGGSFKTFIPPIQTDTGIKIGQILAEYARREYKLVNISSEGVLLVWAPNYSVEPSYRVEYHADEERNRRNGMLDATYERKIDGVYTKVTCVSTNVYGVKYKTGENPNVDKTRRDFINTGSLPFFRNRTISDTDMTPPAMVERRAQLEWQRGQFESDIYSFEVVGHSQGGLFWTPDTIVSVNDSANKVYGNRYISACQYMRDRGGTRTKVTTHPTGFLLA